MAAMPYTPEMTYEWDYPAIVLSVVDGTTFYADIDLGFNVHVHALVSCTGIVAEPISTRRGLDAKKEAQKLLRDMSVLLRTRELSSLDGRMLVVAEIAYSPYIELRAEQASFKAAMLATGLVDRTH